MSSETKVLRGIRRFCMECQGGLASSVRGCPDAACALYPWRLSDVAEHDPAAGKALRGVRRYCIACAGCRAELRICNARQSCQLWPYRFGVLPSTYQRVMRRIRQPKLLWLPGLGKK